MRVIKAYRNASDDILLRSKAKPYDLRNKDEVNKAYHHHNQLLHHCLTFLKGKAIGLAGSLNVEGHHHSRAEWERTDQADESEHADHSG